MRWDLFVSYASEDRDEVAVPLAAALTEAGLRVWIDQTEMRLGDSLREKIDLGLANSNFGVVVLSESYFSKRWPVSELNGLFAKEENGHHVLLPVWHNLDKKWLLGKSPLLADRAAANTSDGITAVARIITEAIFDPTQYSPERPVTTMAGRLRHLMGESTALNVADPAIKNFLRQNSQILSFAFGNQRLGVRADLKMGPHLVDFAVGTKFPTTNQWSWRMVILGPVAARLTDNDEDPRPAAELRRLIREADAVHAWVNDNLGVARKVLPDLRTDSDISIVFGRRTPTSYNSHWLAELNDSLLSVRIRTYDWLIEAAANLVIPEL